jgi:hypothetical protein
MRASGLLIQAYSRATAHRTAAPHNCMLARPRGGKDASRTGRSIDRPTLASDVKSERLPNSEWVLRGEDWIIAGYVIDGSTMMKQGKQPWHFQKAPAHAHGHTKRLDCEFIYGYDGSTLGNAQSQL